MVRLFVKDFNLVSEFDDAFDPPGLSKFKNTIHLNTLFQNENTSQSQGESKYVRNTIPIYPPTTETNQMLILRYLTSMGEYQEVSFSKYTLISE